ncbi:FimV/HubP family polar landmark protein [Uliginosibacterium paludis]|uniref:FimV/HubP family polar landmark protein n=1 Tax=Uliginosibacterium paludis TaxID=1615952 RepID=A0ABV2CKP6_9RHOO
MLRKTLAAAIMFAFWGSAGAAGLGRLNVMSSLGQPLRAEVEITATPEELETMVAKLASAEAFKRANIDYLGAYGDVRLSVEKRAGNSVLRIQSARPFNEPYVDLLVDLNWAGGRLLREFTFLLDPAEVTSRPAAPAVAAPQASRMESQAIAPVAPRPAPASASAKAEAPASTSRKSSAARPAPAQSADGQYTVAKGDTLNSIVHEFKPDEVSQEQMLAAFYRANTEAFAGGNINRLRAGRILKVPSAEEATAIPRKEARQVVLKASSFESYRQSVAGAAAAAPARESAAGQGNSGKIASKVEEKAASGVARDKVTVTASEQAKPAAAQGDANAKARIQSLQDELASRDKALKEANSRVSDLENNIRELQKLVELKNQGLADAQRQAAAQQASSAAASSQASSAPVVEQQATSSIASVPIEPVAEDSAPVVATPVAEASPVLEARPKPVAPQPLPPEPEEEGFLGMHLWALLGALGVVGALGYVIVKQRRKRAAEGTGNTQMTESSTMSPNSVFGSAGGQTVDTGGTSLLHTDFSQSGMSAIDADEGVDPVAEADVYMAYGRDAQAEEILLDALKNDPARTAVYVKLLEIYAQRHEIKSFENVATDLYSQTAGAGDDWAKASAIGLRLDPENPLYRMGASVAEAPQVAAPVPQAAPVVSFGTSNVSQVKSTWTMPGEINQFAEGELPVVAEPERTPTPQPVPESLNLDFDLDLETPANVDAPTEVEMRESDELQMDEATATHPSFGEDSAPLEFDIGFDEGPATVQPLPEVAESSAKADADLGIESASGHDDFAEVDLEKTNFESSLLDFDFELGEETNTKPTLDLSGVKLSQSDASPASHTATSLASSVVLEPIQDSIDVNEEVATKLELAKAYEEMGDMEGARELLEEVISDGGDSQKEHARALLARLS